MKARDKWWVTSTWLQLQYTSPKSTAPSKLPAGAGLSQLLTHGWALPYMHQKRLEGMHKHFHSLAACRAVPRPGGPTHFSGSYKTGLSVSVLHHSISFVFAVEGWVGTVLCFEILWLLFPLTAARLWDTVPTILVSALSWAQADLFHRHDEQATVFSEEKQSSRTTQQKEGWLIWASPLLITHCFIAPLPCDDDLEQERDNSSNKELLYQYLQCAKVRKRGFEVLQQGKYLEQEVYSILLYFSSTKTQRWYKKVTFLSFWMYEPISGHLKYLNFLFCRSWFSSVVTILLHGDLFAMCL